MVDYVKSPSPHVFIHGFLSFCVGVCMCGVGMCLCLPLHHGVGICSMLQLGAALGVSIGADAQAVGGVQLLGEEGAAGLDHRGQLEQTGGRQQRLNGVLP